MEKNNDSFHYFVDPVFDLERTMQERHFQYLCASCACKSLEQFSKNASVRGSIS
jgi:hypothetical protein